MSIPQSIDLKTMTTAAADAIECAKTVNRWLPVEGKPAPAVDASAGSRMDRWHGIAYRAWNRFMDYHPAAGRIGGTNAAFVCYSTIGPDGAAEAWQELCESMAMIGTHYGWHEIKADPECVTDGAIGNALNGHLPPAMPARLIEVIGFAVDAIRSMREDQITAGDTSSDPPAGFDLSNSQTAILEALQSLGATSKADAESQPDVLQTAGYLGSKAEFPKLKSLGLIDSKRSIGSWITAKGIKAIS